MIYCNISTINSFIVEKDVFVKPNIYKYVTEESSIESSIEDEFILVKEDNI